jgi:nucleoside-diphosphate-sugar epimerase
VQHAQLLQLYCWSTLSLRLLLAMPFALQDRAFNDRRYYIGSSKLGALGWVERTSWEEGLQRTIDW